MYVTVLLMNISMVMFDDFCGIVTPHFCGFLTQHFYVIVAQHFCVTYSVMKHLYSALQRPSRAFWDIEHICGKIVDTVLFM